MHRALNCWIIRLSGKSDCIFLMQLVGGCFYIPFFFSVPAGIPETFVAFAGSAMFIMSLSSNQYRTKLIRPSLPITCHQSRLRNLRPAQVWYIGWNIVEQRHIWLLCCLEGGFSKLLIILIQKLLKRVPVGFADGNFILFNHYPSFFDAFDMA